MDLQPVTTNTPANAQNSNVRVTKIPFKNSVYNIEVKPFKTGGAKNPALASMQEVFQSNSRQEVLNREINKLDNQIIEAQIKGDKKDLDANIAGKIMLGLAKTVSDLAPEDKKDKIIGDFLDVNRDNKVNRKDIKDIKRNEPNLVHYATNVLRELKYEPDGDNWAENYKNNMIKSSIIQNMFIPAKE